MPNVKHYSAAWTRHWGLFRKKKSKGLQYEKLFCLQSVGYSY